MVRPFVRQLVSLSSHSIGWPPVRCESEPAEVVHKRKERRKRRLCCAREREGGAEGKGGGAQQGVGRRTGTYRLKGERFVAR